MRNLALQAEVRHVLPPCKDSDGTANIVAVIQNTNTHQHISPDIFENKYFQDSDVEIKRPSQPPVSFVVTSEGKLLALDVNDQLIWIVDLEKVVADSTEDEEKVTEDSDTIIEIESNQERSEWFYAASFVQESSPERLAGDYDGILGMNLSVERGRHITCLSYAGYVVSVSIDDTNTLSSKGGKVEDGSECIGIFENGLECGGWSPDGEVLALVTFVSDADEDGNAILTFNDTEAKVPILMTMNTQYEILSEVRMDPCLFPHHSNSNTYAGNLQSNNLSLCWRPDSSALAVSTMNANFSSTALRQIRTYHRTTLQLLSVSKEEDGSGRDVPNLLPVAPTWAPAGCSHYVGAVQSSRSLTMRSAGIRHVPVQVAFMEPNGLRHRECKIHNTVTSKTDIMNVMSIAFNLEGDLLAVASTVTQNDPASNQSYGTVQLYHRCNFHWYLKYELRFGGRSTLSSSVVSKMKFSDDDSYQLMVALMRQQDNALEWREYTFRWESSTIQYRPNPSTTTSSSMLAVVVDGKTLHFTPLDKSIIPPPMYASSLEFPVPVVEIASRPCFHNEAVVDGQVEFVLALSDGKLALLKSGGCIDGIVSLTPEFMPPSCLAIIDPSKIDTLNETTGIGLPLHGAVLRDLTIIDSNEDALTVIASVCSLVTDTNHYSLDTIIEINVRLIPQANKSDIEVTSLVSIEGRVLRIINWSDTAYTPNARGSALIERNDGSLLEYSLGGLVKTCVAGPMLEPCPWIAGVYNSSNFMGPDTVAEHDDLDESSTRIVVGLSSRGRLYSGERLLSSASSTFIVSLEHMFLTHVTIGSQPKLRFLPLSTLRDFDPLMGSDDQNVALDGYEPRNIERGARLVAMFPTKPIIIVQMPRGNLESISPRACLLPYIMTRIQNSDFQTALNIMRRQRVDMNLIVDFDPVSFLENGGAEGFLDQVSEVDSINLFLSSLVDVDTTLWKYPVPSWIRAEKCAYTTSIFEAESKINLVCRKMRQLMLDAEKAGRTSSGRCVKEGHFLLPVLSTFAKENPPKLEEALILIVSRGSSSTLNQKSVLLSESVQSSIQYLAFLADYELIFNTAIGMYDFNLAKAVARHSQMDPKVYLPILKRWRELPESVARFEVDVKLKRFESALRHLVASGPSSYNESDDGYFSQCLKFIDEHSLHKLGLELFKNNISNHRAILISLGERFLIERKPKEALTIFLASNPKYLDGGKRASRACDDWRTYFACCAENGETIGSDHAALIAESISSKVGSMQEQRGNYACAATILLDYAEDVSYAVDMLILAHTWSEGKRVAYLHKRVDLVKKVIDASVSYARTCVQDLIERASTFETNNKRYDEVILIRREVLKGARETEDNDVQYDDSASMFSMRSATSHASLRSNTSGMTVGSVASVGSATSVSTVISVGDTSTFSFSGDVDTMKHKSKFNTIGRDKKKKKPHKKLGSAARRTKPGSEDELKELVTSLKHTCPDGHYVEVISETITFLLHSGKLSMAKMLFESYKALELTVAQAQTTRCEKNLKAEKENEMNKQKEGHMEDFIRHTDVDAISCMPLPEIQSIFTFLS